MENKDLIEQLKKERINLMQKVSALENAITALGGNLSESGTIVIPAIILDSYPLNATLGKKIIYSLQQLKIASIEEIVEYINTKDNIDPSKLTRVLHTYFSIMKNKGDIIVDRKEGKTSYFKLPV